MIFLKKFEKILANKKLISLNIKVDFYFNKLKIYFIFVFIIKVNFFNSF